MKWNSIIGIVSMIKALKKKKFIMEMKCLFLPIMTTRNYQNQGKKLSKIHYPSRYNIIPTRFHYFMKLLRFRWNNILDFICVLCKTAKLSIFSFFAMNRFPNLRNAVCANCNTNCKSWNFKGWREKINESKPEHTIVNTFTNNNVNK